MIIKSNHYFHIVDQSPWPLSAAIGATIITSGLISLFHSFRVTLLIIGLTVLIATTFQWWRDVSRERTLQGLHTIHVIKGIRWGIILFIVSEILFFFSFFWAFFHSSLAPVNEIGLNWPPTGISVFNPLQVPLLNTIILLSSGVSVTWAHHRIIQLNHSQALQGILLTVILGAYFTILQAFEYLESSFSIADSAYGSTFFIATGFHGLHVIIGSSFLIVCLLRHYFNHFSSYHHFGFEDRKSVV